MSIPHDALIQKVLNEEGFAMDAALRSSAENSFQTALPGIRLHTGETASRAARAVGARAFVFGQHIVFGEGEYQPSTAEGLWILNHELAHCLQQRGATSAIRGVGPEIDSFEAEAERAATLVSQGFAAGPLTSDHSGLLRRVVTIKPGSAKIKITGHPSPIIPAPFTKGSQVTFGGNPIQATGEVTLLGGAGDSAAGWRAGFIQVEWVETNWLYYRGLKNSDGSLFIQRARPPAKPQTATRDTLDRPAGQAGGSTVGLIFYDGLAQVGGVADGKASDTFPLTLKFTHFDSPSNNVRSDEVNEITGADNFLREAQFEDMFCTVLSVRDPANKFHHQAAFYWNVRTQVTISPSGGTFTCHRVTAGTGGATSGIILGNPTDPKFTGVLTSPQTASSNDIFAVATTKARAIGSANRHASAVWSSFNVTRP